jgi:hypothetical protein
MPVITVFTIFRLLTDFVCLYNYEFWLSLCKIVRSSVILLLPFFKFCSNQYNMMQVLFCFHCNWLIKIRKDMFCRLRNYLIIGKFLRKLLQIIIYVRHTRLKMESVLCNPRNTTGYRMISMSPNVSSARLVTSWKRLFVTLNCVIWYSYQVVTQKKIIYGTALRKLFGTWVSTIIIQPNSFLATCPRHDMAENASFSVLNKEPCWDCLAAKGTQSWP